MIENEDQFTVVFEHWKQLCYLANTTVNEQGQSNEAMQALSLPEIITARDTLLDEMLIYLSQLYGLLPEDTNRIRERWNAHWRSIEKDKASASA